MPKLNRSLVLIIVILSEVLAQSATSGPGEIPIAKTDWLVAHPETKAQVTRIGDSEIVLSNGLISRSFQLAPNCATTSLRNLRTTEEYVRSIQPEALLVIDSVSYSVGGLIGQHEHGYLMQEWIEKLRPDSSGFQFHRLQTAELTDQISWKLTRWVPKTQWERTGQRLTFYYAHNELTGIEIAIHYEIYDKIPLVGKWLEVTNNADRSIVINEFTAELIAHHEKNNYVDVPESWDPPNLYIENDYAFGGFTYIESDRAVEWEKDPQYTSQVNWARKMPALLKSRPGIGPEYRLEQGETFQSFHTYTLALDGTNRERTSLSKRKMYRLLAPWVTENPIFMHLTSTDVDVVTTAIDQCAAVGYEMVILSFGSGLSMEDISDANIRKFKNLVDYAHSKGIQLGGYSLFSSRRINDETDVIDINTGKPGGAKFLHAPCGGSEWGIQYFQNLKRFIAETGFDILEHDGPYPGDFCASTLHPGHHGYGDSQWKQWRQTTDFYKWLRAEGVYLNVPDFYILSGTNKVGIGYREVNWSLPRAQQIILGRQNIYDGTWLRTPSMGWTFVPLTEYHGGGEAATLEPLSEHLAEYDAHMTQNYGSGVQACYRGPRLYDTDETKALVKRKIAHYKEYRDILNADIIHLRRPDGRDWDGILHADPQLRTKGYAMIYNPTSRRIDRTIRLPLYYTGLRDWANVSISGGEFLQHKLNREYEIDVSVQIPANGNLYIVIK